MAFNWIMQGAKDMYVSNATLPGTNRHIQNVIWQRNTLVGQENHTADIGNGKTVTVTVNDVIRKSGRPKWEVIGVCSDGRSITMVEEKAKQPNKMAVAEAVVRKFM